MVKVIAHPETSLVITPSVNNPEYGTFRVDSEHKSLENGFVNIQKRSAFIRGRVSDLTQLGLVAGMKLPGNIIKKESFDPFYESQPAKINPQTKEVILTNGKETYLEYQYTELKDAKDVWVDSTPVEVAETTQEELARQGM